MQAGMYVLRFICDWQNKGKQMPNPKSPRAKRPTHGPPVECVQYQNTVQSITTQTHLRRHSNSKKKKSPPLQSNFTLSLVIKNTPPSNSCNNCSSSNNNNKTKRFIMCIFKFLREQLTEPGPGFE